MKSPLKQFSETISRLAKKFPKTNAKEKFLGLHAAIETIENAYRKKDKKGMGRRIGALLVAILDVANLFKIDPEKVLKNRIKEISRAHGICKK